VQTTDGDRDTTRAPWRSIPNMSTETEQHHNHQTDARRQHVDVGREHRRSDERDAKVGGPLPARPCESRTSHASEQWRRTGDLY
jgi:hypothetical protein